MYLYSYCNGFVQMQLMISMIMFISHTGTVHLR